MYRRSRRRSIHRQTQRIGLFVFLRKPAVQLAILAIAAFIIAAILLMGRR